MLQANEASHRLEGLSRHVAQGEVPNTGGSPEDLAKLPMLTPLWLPIPKGLQGQGNELAGLGITHLNHQGQENRQKQGRGSSRGNLQPLQNRHQ